MAKALANLKKQIKNQHIGSELTVDKAVDNAVNYRIREMSKIKVQNNQEAFEREIKMQVARLNKIRSKIGDEAYDLLMDFDARIVALEERAMKK